jgi:heme/copper-type cytochrome/quinol oxidase subunit 2
MMKGEISTNTSIVLTVYSLLSNQFKLSLCPINNLQMLDSITNLFLSFLSFLVLLVFNVTVIFVSWILFQDKKDHQVSNLISFGASIIVAPFSGFILSLFVFSFKLLFDLSWSWGFLIFDFLLSLYIGAYMEANIKL